MVIKNGASSASQEKASQAISRLWEQVATQLNRSTHRLNQGLSYVSRFLDVGSYVPDCEFEERAQDYCFSVDLPGVHYQDVHIELAGRHLRIYGERRRPKQLGSRLHRREKGYGTFERSLTLPQDADIDQVNAAYEDGVLNVWIQKLPSHPPKVIPVDHSTAAELGHKHGEFKPRNTQQNQSMTA
ncbi:MAG: Hsp20/alpha crystallin family protein [Oligoflexus sp.]